jgi:transposase InsO family protein
MRQDVQKYIRGCIVCQKTKPPSSPQANPLNPLPVAGAPQEVISWDLIGILPKSWTYNAIVTIVDTHKKGIKLKPTNATISAMGMAIIMRDRVYHKEGLQAKVYSDCRPQFISNFMRQLYELLGIEGNLSTAYHPQTNRKQRE